MSPTHPSEDASGLREAARAAALRTAFGPQPVIQAELADRAGHRGQPGPRS